MLPSDLSLMYSQCPRNWKVAFPKIRICIPLGLWKINLLSWYFVFHWDRGKTDWVLMLKYLKLLCRFREYLERDFCKKKSAQETNICMASFGQCLFMRYIFSLRRWTLFNGDKSPLLEAFCINSVGVIVTFVPIKYWACKMKLKANYLLYIGHQVIKATK